MIPESFIDDLVSRLDVVDVVSRYVDLKKKGANYSGLCPFHQEKTPSFTVSGEKQFYHCFGCGAHGGVLKFVMEYRHFSFVETIETLAQEQGLTVPYERGNIPLEQAKQIAEEKARVQSSCLDVLAEASAYYKNSLRKSDQAIDYLKKRGLTGNTAARFELGFAPEGWQNLASCFRDYKTNSALLEAGLVIDKAYENQKDGQDVRRFDFFRERIMFPIHNHKGEVIGMGGRILGKGEPKYLNSPETTIFNKKSELYGLYHGQKAIREHNWAVVVEGYMDVIALSQAGIGNSVATLGTACGEAHLKKIWRYCNHVIFAFDGDTAGQKAAHRVLALLIPLVTEKKRASFLYLPKEHDPDSYVQTYGKQAFLSLVEQAKPFSTTLIQYICDKENLLIPEGRAAVWSKAKQWVDKMQPTSLKTQILNEFKKLSNITPSAYPKNNTYNAKNYKKKSWLEDVGGEKGRRPSPIMLEDRLVAYILHQPLLVKTLETELWRRFVDLVDQTTKAPMALKKITNLLNSSINSENDQYFHSDVLMQQFAREDDMVNWQAIERIAPLLKEVISEEQQDDFKQEFGEMVMQLVGIYQKFF